MGTLDAGHAEPAHALPTTPGGQQARLEGDLLQRASFGTTRGPLSNAKDEIVTSGRAFRPPRGAPLHFGEALRFLFPGRALGESGDQLPQRNTMESTVNTDATTMKIEAALVKMRGNALFTCTPINSRLPASLRR